VQGPTLLAEVLAFADVPVVAIGGITAHNLEALDVRDRVQVAVCQSVIGAADPAWAARGLKERLDQA
jgi:thiamine-phosphate pyrophosphorylase